MNVVRRSMLVTSVAAGATLLAMAVAPSANAAVVPKVTRVSPTSGFTAGGARVTVTGSGFSHVAAVYFGATKGGSIKVLSTTALTVTAPAHVDGRVDVRVKTTTAESPITTVDRFTYVPTPVSGVTEPGATSHTIALSWSNPKDPYFNGGVVRRNVGTTAPTTATTGTASGTFSKTTHMLVVSGLSPGTTYAFSVFARDANGHYSVAAKIVKRTLVVGSPGMVDVSHANPQAVSCIDATLCALVDATGSAATFDGSSWAAPTKVDFDSGLSDISCTSMVCAAVGNGDANVFTIATGWVTTVIDPGHNLTSVSCANDGKTGFCTAVDNVGNAFIFGGSTWSAPAAVDAGHALTSVSCVSSTYCVAVDDAGRSVRYTGSWAAAGSTSASTELDAVSCVTTTFCLALADDGTGTLFSGDAWSPRSTDIGGPLACVTTTFCLAVDELSGSSRVFNGASWGSAVQVANPLPGRIVDVACGSTTMCVALGSDGRSYTFNGSSWTGPQTADSFSVPVGVQCASIDFCMVADTLGQTATFTGKDWSALTPTSLATLGAFSCASVSFCVAVDGDSAAVYNGSGWAPVSLHPWAGHSATDVSCASTTFCAVVDDGGGVTFFNGSTWSRRGSVGLDPFEKVSCGSTSLCIALDAAGRFLNFNGSTWSSPTYVDTFSFAGALSCPPGGRFCAAADDAGNVMYFDGSKWSGLTSIASDRLFSLSCLATRYCYATTATAVIGFGQALPTITEALPARGLTYQVSCAAGPACVLYDADGEALRMA